MNYDIIIVGGGVAGLTAAIYARRANKSVLVLEGTVFGGQVLQIEKIPNYPALPDIRGKALAAKLRAQAKSFGATLKTEKVTSLSVGVPPLISEKKIGGRFASLTISKYADTEIPRWEIHTDLYDESAATEFSPNQTSSKSSPRNTKTPGLYRAHAVIIASGTDYRHMNIPGEEELTGHGVSYCATCDGALYKDKTVAVYGGGNSAFYSALYLSAIAKKVYLIHHSSTFRADASFISQVKNTKNIQLVLGHDISELKGSKKLTGLKLTDGSSLSVNGLFVTIGREPRLDFLDSDLNLDLDKTGAIEVDEDCQTSEDGLFAAGDCVAKSVHQIVTACSDGAIAASSAVKYLND